MFDMTKIYFHKLLDWLHLVLVVDVHKGADDEKNLRKVVLQLKKCYRMMYKKFQGYSSSITTLFRLPEQLKLPTPLPNFYEKKNPAS